MNNDFSQVTIKVPTIPDDFEAKAGTSKTDLARAILDLIQNGSQLNGINLDTPQNFDLNQIQNQLDTLTTGVTAAKLQQRTVSLSGIDSGLLTIPFDDIGTTNYMVNAIVISTNTNINTVTWSLIAGSKTSSQCQIRIDGDASPYTVEVQITEIKS